MKRAVSSFFLLQSLFQWSTFVIFVLYAVLWICGTLYGLCYNEIKLNYDIIYPIVIEYAVLCLDVVVSVGPGRMYMLYLPIFLRVASLALGQSCNCTVPVK